MGVDYLNVLTGAACAQPELELQLLHTGIDVHLFLSKSRVAFSGAQLSGSVAAPRTSGIS